MVKKVLAIAAMALLAVAGPAAAGEGYADDDTVVVSDSSVVPGQEITISAKTFQPGSSVTFTLFSAPVVLGTATADDFGVASLTTTIPANTSPGTHTIEASGTGIDGLPLTVTSTITVLAAGAADPGTLPTTGSSSTISLSQIAIAAVAAGGAMILVANKRRQASAQRETAGV